MATTPSYAESCRNADRVGHGSRCSGNLILDFLKLAMQEVKLRSGVKLWT
jgi:hypothetical protein